LAGRSELRDSTREPGSESRNARLNPDILHSNL
jgi:hypothetical protein